MPTDASPSAGSGTWVEVLEENEDYRYKDLFKVIRARVRYRRADRRMGEPTTRVAMARADAVAVLLYDPSDEAVLLVRQFRYPVYQHLSQEARAGEGARQAWLLEVVAGIQEPGATAEETARAELMEETGYQVDGALPRIAEFYLSPGGSGERVTLFLAEVNDAQRTGAGGGLVDEGEDTELVRLPCAQAFAMIAGGEIQDAKTIVALQHLALLRGDRDKATSPSEANTGQSQAARE